MPYLSLSTFEKTDKESRKLANRAFLNEDPSSERLYWMVHNMKDNEYYRSRMSDQAKGLSSSQISETRQEALEEKQKKLSAQIDAIETAVEQYCEASDKNYEEFKERVDGKFDIEEDDEMDDEFDDEEEEYEKDDFLEQSEKLLIKLKTELKSFEKMQSPNLETKADTAVDEEYEEVMSEFAKMVIKDDIASPEGLKAIEENLKCAIKLLVGGTAKRQLRMLIKPAAIQNLLTTFQNLRKTQWDNRVKYLPKNLNDHQQESLISVYKSEFLDAYEREARKFLSDYDYDLNKPGLTDRLKNKIKANMDIMLEKFTSKMDFGIREKFDKKKAKLHEIKENLKAKLKAKFAKEDDEDQQEDTPEKEMAVSQKVLDLVAVTLRPKTDETDGRAVSNTYGAYYNELKSIMDEYIEEDDHSTSSSSLVTMELKVTSKEELTKSNTCLYTLYAVLADYAGITTYPKKDNVLNRDDQGKTEFSTDVKFFSNNDQFKVTDKSKKAFEPLVGKLKTFWAALDRDKIKRESEIIALLKEFTTYTDKASLKEMFSFLCSDNKIKLGEGKCEKYFDKLIDLRDKQPETQPENRTD